MKAEFDPIPVQAFYSVAQEYTRRGNSLLEVGRRFFGRLGWCQQRPPLQSETPSEALIEAVHHLSLKATPPPPQRNLAQPLTLGDLLSEPTVVDCISTDLQLMKEIKRALKERVEQSSSDEKISHLKRFFSEIPEEVWVFFQESLSLPEKQREYFRYNLLRETDPNKVKLGIALTEYKGILDVAGEGVRAILGLTQSPFVEDTDVISLDMAHIAVLDCVVRQNYKDCLPLMEKWATQKQYAPVVEKYLAASNHLRAANPEAVTNIDAWAAESLAETVDRTNRRVMPPLTREDQPSLRIQ